MIDISISLIAASSASNWFLESILTTMSLVFVALERVDRDLEAPSLGLRVVAMTVWLGLDR